MTTHERILRRSRACHAGSIVLFVLFCLFGAGGSTSALAPWLSKALQLVGFLSGILAWTLMCTAYDLRRKAL